MLTRFKKLWNRYNPKRKHIDMDEDRIVFFAEIGFVEYYRGEWFLTEAGLEALREGINRANIRS